MTGDLRIFDGRDGRYLHAGDLVALLRRHGTADTASPIIAAAVPAIIRVIEHVAELPPVEPQSDKLHGCEHWSTTETGGVTLCLECGAIL